MAVRVKLDDVDEGGLFALLKDVEELNSGDRRAVRGAVPVQLASDGKTLLYPGDYDDQMKNALLCRIVTEWNLPQSTPDKDPDVLDRLSIDQIDRLYDAVAKHVDHLNKDRINPNERGSDPT